MAGGEAHEKQLDNLADPAPDPTHDPTPDPTLDPAPGERPGPQDSRDSRDKEAQPEGVIEVALRLLGGKNIDLDDLGKTVAVLAKKAGSAEPSPQKIGQAMKDLGYERQRVWEASARASTTKVRKE